MIKVVIVNEINVLSEGLKHIINSQNDMRVLDIMNDRKRNYKELHEMRPDVILFHIRFMHTKTSVKVHTYKKQHPDTRLIYIAPRFSKGLFYDAAENKPDGFLTDDMPPEKFVEGIREIYKEQYIVSGEIAMELLKGIQYISELKKLVLKKKLEERNIRTTLRDLDVLYLIYLEKNNQEIVKLLSLPEKSVRYYVSKAYKKLERKNRSETIAFLQELIDQ